MRVWESEQAGEEFKAFSRNELLPPTKHVEDQDSMLIQTLQSLLGLDSCHGEYEGTKFAKSDAIHPTGV